jgi:glycosyltransferase involved in cell wall biosynthesis
MTEEPLMSVMETNYSVLMPLWYKEKPEFLKASIGSMAKQTIPPSDFVLVRDHEIPSELTAVIEQSVGSIPVNYVDAYELFGHGLGSILAKGVENCSYELIARMDSDDIAFPDRCEKQLAVFTRNPELAIVGGTIAEFSDTPEKISSYRMLPEKHEDIIKFAKHRNPFNHPSVMLRKNQILNVDNYDTSFKACEDYDLWFRVLMNGGEGYNIVEPVLYFRAGENLIKHRGGKKNYQFYIKLKKKMWDNNFISWFDFLISINIQRFFYYSPFFIQKMIYVLLRKNKTRDFNSSL